MDEELTLSYAEVASAGDREERAQLPKQANQSAVFPLLQDNESLEGETQPIAGRARTGTEDNDGEPAVAKPFVRTSSPGSEDRKQDASARVSDQFEKGYDEKDSPPERLVYKMHKFSLYETASRFYVVGVDVSEQKYRILKVDRMTEDDDELSITDDKILYNMREMNQLLDTIDDGNKGTGGIKLRCTTWGILGFIRFTNAYYMLLITKKSTVAMVGGHYIYQIEGTELVPLTFGMSKPDKSNADEQRFLSILHNIDLTKSFYYSYSYDVTRTLQHNITRERAALAKGEMPETDADFNSMFTWNDYLLRPIVAGIKDPYDWCRPIIHGYVDQAALSIYGRTAHITVIARRSRYFAGARFLKRGANDWGYVANDVETEQIVAESQTTSFHAPGGQLYCNPQYTSYVQHRGSIPLHWTQDSTGVTPKPPIELNLVDPFYGAAALHFNDLFERYGAPIYALNLVKSKERQPRESKLLDEYTNAIKYLNQFLPKDKQIIHKAWDMSRASKVRGGDVIGTLETIAEEVLELTGFFQNGDGVTNPSSAQNGVARTNCIDCLDRTNAAQFVIGKRALGHQLHALGIIENRTVEYDTDAVNLFTHMWHDHGDTMALQYGGSQLVNTMETYRKINQWTSHSRDMIESFKRYYNNSFLDNQRQEAYNLFLGNYVFAKDQPMLWDLNTDYYLHHADPKDWSATKTGNYVNWFTPEFLKERTIPPLARPQRKGAAESHAVDFYDDYWLEYYRPATLSSFPKMFAYKMNSTIKYIPINSTKDGHYDLSPFKVRIEDIDHDKKKAKKGGALSPNPSARNQDDNESIASDRTASRGVSFRWLQPAHKDTEQQPKGTQFDTSATDAAKTKQTALEKSDAAQWTFTKAVDDSLNPSVSAHEADDYARYIKHPQNLPLVVSSDTPADVDSSEYEAYVNGEWQEHGLMVLENENEAELYAELLKIGENPLTVTEEDGPKKRYKAYRKWLRGKSFFKQQPLD